MYLRKTLPSNNVFLKPAFYDLEEKLIKGEGIKEAPVSLNLIDRMRIPKVSVSIYCACKIIFFSGGCQWCRDKGAFVGLKGGGGHKWKRSGLEVQ